MSEVSSEDASSGTHPSYYTDATRQAAHGNTVHGFECLHCGGFAYFPSDIDHSDGCEVAK